MSNIKINKKCNKWFCFSSAWLPEIIDKKKLLRIFSELTAMNFLLCIVLQT